MRVIATAGHVDHGKSALIAALTGTHPDRLKEEQERQMTIDLGFGWLTLPGGEQVGIVDVPGHRDFIENMLAGVGGIDAALLVIAADEGIMPQTREHLAILDLLQIEAGLVVLTKIDLVDDPAWLDLAEADIRSVLGGTVLQAAPILRVSSRTKAGFPQLLQTLEQLLQKVPPRPDLGRARLPVDRVFSMPGFGTVVTGTLADGRLASGDEVELLPSGLAGRVRNLQSHFNQEQFVSPGSRTGVNLAGLNVEQIHRGDVVVHPGQYHPTQRLDVHFRLLDQAAGPLHHRTEVKLFLCTAEVIASVRLLGVETLQPGQQGWLQLECKTPLLAVRGDHYILRRPSPGETLGGGMVVDPHPKARHKRFDGVLLEALESMARGTPAEVLRQASLALGPAPVTEVVSRSRLESHAAESAVQELTASGQLIRLQDVIIAAPDWSALKQSIESTLAAYHRDHPLRRGMPRQELKSRLKLPPRLFNLLLPRLSDEGTLVENQKWIALPGHVVRFSPFQQVQVDALFEQFAAAPFAPPSIKECLAEVGEEIFGALLESGELLAVSDEVVFRKGDHAIMLGRIRQELQRKGRISLAEVRDLLQTSRRYAQALLEHLDATGVTAREGDLRKLRAD